MQSIKQTMTKKLVTIPWGSTLAEADELMGEKRIRHLPVIDEDGDVLGILAKKDVSTLISSKSLTVEKVMMAPVEYVDEEVSLRSAILKMLEKKISCLLISNSEGQAVGILTTDDLLWYLAHMLSEDANKENSALNVWKDKAMQTVGQLADKLATMGI